MKTQHSFLRFAVRKALFTIATVCAVAITQVSLAAEGPEPKASKLQSTFFQIPNSLKFKAIATGCGNKFSIVIRGYDHTPIYSEFQTNGQDYMRTFDLSTLTDGEYTFEISNGEETIKKTFTIETTMARMVSVN